MCMSRDQHHHPSHIRNGLRLRLPILISPPPQYIANNPHDAANAAPMTGHHSLQGLQGLQGGRPGCAGAGPVPRRCSYRCIGSRRTSQSLHVDARRASYLNNKALRRKEHVDVVRRR